MRQRFVVERDQCGDDADHCADERCGHHGGIDDRRHDRDNAIIGTDFGGPDIGDAGHLDGVVDTGRRRHPRTGGRRVLPAT